MNDYLRIGISTTIECTKEDARDEGLKFPFYTYGIKFSLVKQ